MHSRRLLGNIAAVVVLCGLFPATAWAADPVSLDEYWRRIAAAVDWLDGAEQDAVAAADELAPVEAVVLPDGRVVPVDNSDLVAILRRGDLDPDDVAAVRSRLAALQRARDAALDRPTLSTDQAFAQLGEILARPEFAPKVEPQARESLLQRAAESLSRTLGRWLGRVWGQPATNYVLTGLGLAAVLAVLIYFFRGAWRQWITEGRGKRDGVTGAEESLSSGEAAGRAQALSASGDYRQAVRYLYLSTLLWLDERRLLRYDPALTNREYLRQVTGQGGLHQALSPVVDLFERVWYGFAPLDSRGYTVYAQQVARVRQVNLRPEVDAG